MEEIWKDIPGYEGLYQVSNMGRIRSPRNGFKTLSPNDAKGYLRISLYKCGKICRKSVHRLVAVAFVENPFNKPVINHKDGNKHNNSAENLEWVTNKENVMHARETGLIKNLHQFKGCRHSEESKRKISEKATGKIKWDSWPKRKVVGQYTLSGDFIRAWKGFDEIERVLGYSASNVCACCNGRKKTAYGFLWKYESEVMLSDL